jgi:hypothetical protein
MRPFGMVLQFSDWHDHLTDDQATGKLIVACRLFSAVSGVIWRLP